MKSVAVEEFVCVAEFCVNQDWPVLREDFEKAMAFLGWEADDKMIYYSNFGLTISFVSEVISDNSRGLDSIRFNVTDAVRESSAERDSFMNDCFVQFAAALSELWGKGRRKRTAKSVSAQWELENGCRAELCNMWSSVFFSLDSPVFARALRNLERRG